MIPLTIAADLRHVATAPAERPAVALALMSGPETILAMTVVGGVIALLFPLLRAVALRVEGRERTRGATSDVAERLERIERGVEAIAVEVERITENQRFVTQLLSKPEPVRALDRGRNDPAGT